MIIPVTPWCTTKEEAEYLRNLKFLSGLIPPSICEVSRFGADPPLYRYSIKV